MDTITRKNIRTIEKDAMEALQAVAEKHGLDISVVSGSFNPTCYKARLSFAVKGDNGVPKDFARNAERLGLDPNCYGKTFTTFSGKSFRITGINLRRRKYPVSAEQVSTGKSFKFPVSQVKFGLAA